MCWRVAGWLGGREDVCVLASLEVHSATCFPPASRFPARRVPLLAPPTRPSPRPPLRPMSSLAGALIPPDLPFQAHDTTMLSPKAEDDLDDLFQDIQSQDAASADEDRRPESSAPSEQVDQDDRLSSPDRRHREQLEYAEDENEPEPQAPRQLLAGVSLPNIPVPRSSDANVSPPLNDNAYPITHPHLSFS